LLLLRERFAEGWPELEWRPWTRRLRDASNPVKAPLWSGGGLAGTLLLRGEQGVGEEILHAGLMPEALTRAPRILLECDPRLIPLLARSMPQVECVARADPPDPRLLAADIAAQASLGSLPRWLRRRVKNLLPGPPYLAADPARAAALRERYQALGPGPLVGIAWRSVNPRLGHAKTVPLDHWAPILSTPGVTFINLQYGDCAAELRRPDRRPRSRHYDRQYHGPCGRRARQADLDASVHRSRAGLVLVPRAHGQSVVCEPAPVPPIRARRLEPGDRARRGRARCLAAAMIPNPVIRHE
jgi:hypothetical protein